MNDYLKSIKRDLWVSLQGLEKPAAVQRSSAYIEWIDAELTEIVKRYLLSSNLSESKFIRALNKIYRTERFDVLLKKYLVDYLFDLFNLMYDYSYGKAERAIALEDNPLNRFAFLAFSEKFNPPLKVAWYPPRRKSARGLGLVWLAKNILSGSLKGGLRLSGPGGKFKVMREAIWGLYGLGGKYFHDDFMVDGEKIRPQDLLLYSRGIPTETGRLKGYQDARRSAYAHFDLWRLQLGLKPLLRRIIPRYLLRGLLSLAVELNSENYSLYFSLFNYFTGVALPYEKLFSNYEVASEFGHSYFSASHVVEAIICQNHRTKYYLIHWSDNSVGADKYLLSFLGCDKFLLWGEA
ncbi:MAG: hypothetical protein PHG97_02110, partial [Candidatus Margulisbacteria bacterium]|nr:hypothetical protein [Candidatus Margulisiibacteriota bacterium]